MRLIPDRNISNALKADMKKNIVDWSDELPKWLKQKGEYSYATIFDTGEIWGQPLDHFQQRKIKDKDGNINTVYISQPYGITSRDLKHITRICDKNNIEFYINGDSDHFPGWTIMIEWSQKGKDKE